ncbi:MAG: hypothetical protein FJ272_12095, partial [Planctomycetes bacterium]|nr:hypothetical protein [Planctomycetota bacterium]
MGSEARPFRASIARGGRRIPEASDARSATRAPIALVRGNGPGRPGFGRGGGGRSPGRRPRPRPPVGGRGCDGRSCSCRRWP